MNLNKGKKEIKEEEARKKASKKGRKKEKIAIRKELKIVKKNRIRWKESKVEIKWEKQKSNFCWKKKEIKPHGKKAIKKRQKGTNKEKTATNEGRKRNLQKCRKEAKQGRKIAIKKESLKKESK